jgi:hypothetical protein
MIEIALARLEARVQGRHFGMTRSAHRIRLRAVEFPDDDGLEFVFIDPVSRGAHGRQVSPPRPVARFAVDSRFSPGCAVGVGLDRVVLRKLRDVAVIARRVRWDKISPLQARARANSRGLR